MVINIKRYAGLAKQQAQKMFWGVFQTRIYKSYLFL